MPDSEIRPLYFILGVGLGVVIAYVFDYASYLMVAVNGQTAGMIRNSGDVLNNMWASVGSSAYQWPPSGGYHFVNFAIGAGTGAGSQPLHGFYGTVLGRGYPRSPRIEGEQPSGFTIQSGRH